MPIMTTVQLPRGAAAGMPALADGQLAWATDTHALYCGQGGLNWIVGGSGYTDEEAQDAVGGIVASSARVTLTYVDAAPSLTADLVADSITAGFLHASAVDVLFGRSAAGAGPAAEIACTGAGRTLIAGANAAAQRASLGLGTAALSASGDFQPANAALSLVAGLTPAADRLVYYTGAGAAALATFTAAGRAVAGGADAAAQRTALGLGSVAVLATDGNAAHYLSGAGTWTTPTSSGTIAGTLDAQAMVKFSAQGTVPLIANTPALAVGTNYLMRVDPGAGYFVQGVAGGAQGRLLVLFNYSLTTSFWLVSEFGGATAANRLTLPAASVEVPPGCAATLYYDGLSTSRWLLLGDVAPLSGRLLAVNNLSDLYDVPTARANLGLAVGFDVQAWSAGLELLAALTPAADRLPYYTGAGAAALATFTAAGRALAGGADAAAQRTALGLGSLAVASAVAESMLAFTNVTTANVTAAQHGLCPVLPADATKYLDGSGAWTAPGGGWTSEVVKPSDQDVTFSATLADDAALTLNVGTGEVWLFELLLLYSGNDVAGDYKFDMAVSAGTMRGWHRYCGSDGLSDTVNVSTGVQDAAVANWSAAVACGVDATDTTRTVLVEGMYRFTNAGAFKVRFAQSSATTGKHARTKAGSVLRGRKLA